MGDERKPLYGAHGEVDGSAHVVCREAADESVEFIRSRADPEKEGDFDEEDDK